VTGAETLELAKLFVALLVALALIGLVSGRYAVPYTVALVVFGLLVSVLAPQSGIAVTPELILAIFVPGLIFDAAFRMDLALLRRNLAGVLLLALPGVLIVAGLVTLVLHLATGMPYASAFLVGAMVSATDPVAVISTMRRTRVSRSLANLVEAESLFNDGTGVVLFSVAISGADLLGAGAATFAATIAVSVAIGAAVGTVTMWVASRTEDVNLELTLTLIAAYGSYLAADAAGLSGIIATLMAGIIIGSYGHRRGLSARARVAIDTVWEYLAFLLTAFVFLLIGLAITPADLIGAAWAIGWGVVAVLLGRAVVVYGLLGGLGRTALGRRVGLDVPRAWLHVVFWAGLRGAIAVALALSVPGSQADRGLLESVVFGIVIFTLLVQGGTAARLLRWSGVSEGDADARTAVSA
jgi:CPA1 family monovalent cation:H+ antiporter